MAFPKAFVKYKQQLWEVATRATTTYGSCDVLGTAPMLTFQIPISQLLNATGSSHSFRDILKHKPEI